MNLRDRNWWGQGSKTTPAPPCASEPVRLFDSEFLERFTRTSVQAIVLFWVPVFLLCLSLGLWFGQFSLPEVALIVAAGALIWTLLEYLLHRFLFHVDRLVPRTRGF